MKCYKQPFGKMLYKKHKPTGGFQDLKVHKLLGKLKTVVDGHSLAEQITILKPFNS
jgi:hypothetical protein